MESSVDYTALENFKWSEAVFGMAHDAIDKEHQGLFAGIRALGEAKGKPAQTKALETLIGAVAAHFKTEEDAFAAKKYEHSVAHKKIHDSFVETCLGVQKKFLAGEAELDEATLQFLRTWLVDHITKSDIKYKGKI